MSRRRSLDDDPLDALFQMEDVEDLPVEREALKLIVRLLEDIEEPEDFERNLGILLEGNEQAKPWVISLLHSAIQILEAEVAILGLMGTAL